MVSLVYIMNQSSSLKVSDSRWLHGRHLRIKKQMPKRSVPSLAEKVKKSFYAFSGIQRRSFSPFLPQHLLLTCAEHYCKNQSRWPPKRPLRMPWTESPFAFWRPRRLINRLRSPNTGHRRLPIGRPSSA